MEGKVFQQETNQYKDQLKSGSNNILVAIRVRPLSPKEQSSSSFEIVRVLDQQVIVLLDPGYEFEPEDVFRKNRNKETQFAFDFAFDKTVDQKIVYEQSTQFLIDGILDGYNATIFAYGATGAGKTYTMVGIPENPGIMYRALNDLYNKIEAQKIVKEFKLSVSYLEIYNENIKDLLSSEDHNLDIREDPLRGVVIFGITEVEAKSTSEILSLLKIGNKNRTMESTTANEFSSRSHAILQVHMEIREKNQGINEEIHASKLSLVDLAGSERGANSQNKGQRMMEGAKINQSLLVLGNCIQALSENQEKGGKSFIPYRGSKLTRLLKDSLGGNCRTVMIANVSPCVASFEDTYNTLNYANRAKSIKINATRNVLNIDSHIANYTQIIDGLRKENENLKKILSEKGGLNVVKEEVSKQQEIVKRLEMDINSHFQEEMDTLKKIYDIEEKVQTNNITQFKISTDMAQFEEKTPEKIALREKLDQVKLQLDTLDKAKADLKREYQFQLERRNTKVNNIRQADIGNINQSYLLSIYKQGQLMENYEIQFKEKVTENESKAKEIQLAFLHHQIKIRDDIISDQKSVITANKIPTRISYASLKSIDEISAEAKISFPIINRNYKMIMQQSLNEKKYQFRRPHYMQEDKAIKFPQIQQQTQLSSQSEKKPAFMYNKGKIITGNNEVVDISRDSNSAKRNQRNPLSQQEVDDSKEKSAPIKKVYNYQLSSQQLREKFRRERLNQSISQSQDSQQMNASISGISNNSEEGRHSSSSGDRYAKKQQKAPKRVLYKQFEDRKSQPYTVGSSLKEDKKRGNSFLPRKLHESPYVQSFEKPSNETTAVKMERLRRLNINIKHLEQKFPNLKQTILFTLI